MFSKRGESASAHLPNCLQRFLDPGSNPATARASALAIADKVRAPSSPTPPALAIADRDPIPEDDQSGAGILSSLEAAGREAEGVSCL